MKEKHINAPLYQQVRETLRSKISSGALPVGAPLPTEHELAKAFNVSRATVRTALKDLVSHGLVKPTPGVGTIVIRAQTHTRQSRLRGLTEDLRNQGISSEAVILEAAYEHPAASVQHHLKLSRHDRVLRLVRQRKIAGTPFALIISFVPESVGIKPNEDFSGPIYQLIERSHKLHIVYGQDTISARAAKEDEAQALDVQPGTPVLFVRRVAYIEHDRPIEYVEAAIRNDMYEYTVILPR